MLDFNYNNRSEIIFGKNSLTKIPSILKKHQVKSLLLIYSGDFIKYLGIWRFIKESCESLNINFSSCGKVVPNPKIELVRDLVNLGKEKSVDFIIAVGGGSSIDTAKAVSIGINYDGDVWDFFDKGIIPQSSVPVGAITTLPASGSETSNASIISNGLLKKGFENDMIIPKFAIMNPSYTLGLPSYQTSCGCADILSHLLERYFTNEKHVDTTDYLIEGAIKALMLNAQRLMDNPQNYDARAEIQWLASISHSGILDTGRMACWGSHRIEHELSAQYNITHGEGMAIVFPAWCIYMADKNPEKLAQLANRVFNVDYNNYTQKEMAIILSNKLKDFFKSLKLATSLKELDITSKDFETMAKRATSDSEYVGHYLPLYSNDIVNILNLAL